MIINQLKVKQSGFTLMELLIVMSLTIVSVLMTVPGIMQYAHRNMTEITFFRLDSMLQGARWQAIKVGHQIGVCGSSDGNHCDGLWSYYIMEYDEQSSIVINRFKASLSCSLHLSASLGVRDRVIFNPSGTTYLGQQGHFYCDKSSVSFNPILKLSRNGSTQYMT